MNWWLAGSSAAFVAWAVFNYFVPLTVLSFAQRMSIGRIPADILRRANVHRVEYYVANLARGYAFSIWLGWRHAVVLDKNFLRLGAPAQIRFVLAHELGHCALGHLKLRWLAVVTGAMLLPCVRRWLKRLEDQADEFAENLAGLPRAVLLSPETAQVFADLSNARRFP